MYESTSSAELSALYCFCFFNLNLISETCANPFSPFLSLLIRHNYSTPSLALRRPVMAMDHSLVPRDDQAKFQEFYQLYSLCTNDFCPDSYYDYTEHCTVEKCPIASSNYNYLPSLPVNALFLTLFSISLVCYLGQGLLSRRFIGFTIAMVCGNILEILGYIGRIMSHNDPWDQVLYSMILRFGTFSC